MKTSHKYLMAILGGILFMSLSMGAFRAMTKHTTKFVHPIQRALIINEAELKLEERERKLSTQAEHMFDRFNKSMEFSYFVGQFDCINGICRVAYSTDSCWHWIKSPYNDGRWATFDISVFCDSISLD